MCHGNRLALRAKGFTILTTFGIMSKFSKKTIQRILDSKEASIENIIGDFVTLRQKGARWIGLCPFHEDTHATNFVVYPKKRCYKCFACDAKGDVVKFLMESQKMSFGDAIRYLAQKAKISVDGVPVDVTPTKHELPPPLPTLYLHTDMVRHSMRLTCNFHEWLRSLPWNETQRARVDSVLEAYQVGATKQGFALFWQLDVTGTARTGHCMRYGNDGHRAKSGYATDWIHAILRREVVRDKNGLPVKDAAGKLIPRFPEYADDKVEMRQTLFGMHLLNRYPDAEVHIVESEKTALVCAIKFGDLEHHLWMACCGKYNINQDVLKPITDQRRVIALHPDRDGRDEWTQKAREINYKKIYINDTLMDAWVEQDGDKADIADIIIRQLYDTGDVNNGGRKI